MILPQARFMLAVIASTSLTWAQPIETGPTDSGSVAKGLLIVQLVVKSGGYDPGFNRTKYYQALKERIDAVPGVVGVCYIRTGPLKRAEPNIVATTDTDPATTATAKVEQIGTACLDVLRIPMIRGRMFTGQDDAASIRVAIISKSFAMKLFPKVDPIGHRLRIGSDPNDRTIVGIIDDARWWADPGYEAVFSPVAQSVENELQLLIRTRNNPLTIMPAIRREIEAMGVETVRSEKVVE